MLHSQLGIVQNVVYCAHPTSLSIYKNIYADGLELFHLPKIPHRAITAIKLRSQLMYWRIKSRCHCCWSSRFCHTVSAEFDIFPCVEFHSKKYWFNELFSYSIWNQHEYSMWFPCDLSKLFKFKWRYLMALFESWYSFPYYCPIGALVWHYSFHLCNTIRIIASIACNHNRQHANNTEVLRVCVCGIEKWAAHPWCVFWVDAGVSEYAKIEILTPKRCIRHSGSHASLHVEHYWQSDIIVFKSNGKTFRHLRMEIHSHLQESRIWPEKKTQKLR